MTKEVRIPPYYCQPMCENSLNDLCFEKCSAMSEFRLKKGVTLQDLPPFPLNECLNGSVPIEAQRKLGIIYQALAVDFIRGKGAADEHTQVLRGGSRSHLKRGSSDLEDL
jgi:hypothetical protein